MADDLDREVGRLGGRLDSLEDRMGRDEAFTAQKLDTIDRKLDVITEQLAEGRGNIKGGTSVLHWIIAAVGFVGAWLAGGGKFPGSGH